MGKGVARLRLSPLQGQLLRFLEEAGMEDVQTALATFVCAQTIWTSDDLAEAAAHLVRLKLVDAKTSSGETISWRNLRDQLVALPTAELLLTDRGRVALTK
jgi:hypothetical protein